MTTWLHQVPTMALLNARIIGMIANEPSVQDAARACGVGGVYPLVNVSFLTGLMYSILVVPKELYTLSDGQGKSPTDPSRDPSNADLSTLQAEIEALQLERHLAEVKTANQQYLKRPSREVVRLLRNSVSHVNYEILGTAPAYSFRFWNKNKAGETTWEASCSVDQLQSLLLSVGNVLHRYYNSVHHV